MARIRVSLMTGVTMPIRSQRMMVDYAGGKYGAESGEYRHQAVRQDMWMAPLIPEWLDKGYIILVTGDHGMNAFGHHGGTAVQRLMYGRCRYI